MRAKEFVINVPITITFNGDDSPEISTSDEKSGDEMQLNPVMVSPLQQELELKKAELGKNTPVINKLLKKSNIGKESISEEDQIKEEDEILHKSKSLGRGLRENKKLAVRKNYFYTKK